MDKRGKAKLVERFVISDLHLGHANMMMFKRDDGTPLRPFKNVDEMDQTIIDNWNKVVGPHDIVYNLGDVVIARKNLVKLHALNGRKRLIRGNHDIFKLKDYLPFFEDILGVKVTDDFIMSHIPLHPESLGRFKFNVHGHLHARSVLDNFGKPDLRYLCVSVEHINYTPMNVEKVKELLKERNL